MDVEELLAEVQAWAASEPNVRAAFLLGSRARRDVPADELSDVDVVLFAEDPAALVDDPSWLGRFGEPLLTFVEETAVGGERERRVHYADGTDVDFAVFPASAAAALTADPGAATTVARGFRVLHDELGLGELFATLTPTEPPARAPEEVVQDFWYHALWAAKKLRRGEAVTASFCLDAALRGALVELARLHARQLRPDVDTWHGSRFAERWADPRALAGYWRAAAGSPEEIPSALLRLCDAFDELAADLGALDTRAAAARARVVELLP
jgi:aminoglycoside 6-adenylyltransferase